MTDRLESRKNASKPSNYHWDLLNFANVYRMTYKARNRMRLQQRKWKRPSWNEAKTIYNMVRWWGRNDTRCGWWVLVGSGYDLTGGRRFWGRGKGLTKNISNPAMSRIPMKEAPWRLVRSSDLLTRATIHLKSFSYTALLMASTAYSTCKSGQQSVQHDVHHRCDWSAKLLIEVMNRVWWGHGGSFCLDILKRVSGWL